MQKRNILKISKIHAFILKKNAPCKYQTIVVPLCNKEKKRGESHAREQRTPYVE